MNGLDILNLTSSENVLLEAQNVEALSVSNNMFGENNGSCTVWLNADVGKLSLRYPSLIGLSVDAYPSEKGQFSIILTALLMSFLSFRSQHIIRSFSIFVSICMQTHV